jgi:NAD(P)-dependent dehydrogenase (short-subunit alcohol dehydrogenase family)
VTPEGQLRVALVTGGASGIGLGIVRRLAADGMAVVAADRDAEACRRVQTEIGSERIRLVTADIGSPTGARSAIAAAVDAFGRLDLLCNNAVLIRFGDIEHFSPETWREMFRVNVDGPMLCSQAALPHMRRQGSGAIVNIASIAGLVPYARGGAYAATKAALIMLTKVLALEAGAGIRVNCICPGTIRHTPRPGDETTPVRLPIGRRGRSDDVAQLVSYLGSDAASYMTGSAIVLDGGETAGRRVERSLPAIDSTPYPEPLP